MNNAEKQNRVLDNRKIEVTSQETKHKAIKHKIKAIDLWHNTKQTNLCLPQIPEEEDQEKWT